MMHGQENIKKALCLEGHLIPLNRCAVLKGMWISVTWSCGNLGS